MEDGDAEMLINPSLVISTSHLWPDHGMPSQDHAAVISYLDAKVGDLLARLKSLKIDEKTLVFFASDNGAHKEGGHQIASWNWDELGRTGSGKLGVHGNFLNGIFWTFNL